MVLFCFVFFFLVFFFFLWGEGGCGGLLDFGYGAIES